MLFIQTSLSFANLILLPLTFIYCLTIFHFLFCQLGIILLEISYLLGVSAAEPNIYQACHKQHACLAPSLSVGVWFTGLLLIHLLTKCSYSLVFPLMCPPFFIDDMTGSK